MTQRGNKTSNLNINLKKKNLIYYIYIYIYKSAICPNTQKPHLLLGGLVDLILSYKPQLYLGQAQIVISPFPVIQPG